VDPDRAKRVSGDGVVAQQRFEKICFEFRQFLTGFEQFVFSGIDQKHAAFTNGKF
jgi:hypothetical protein